MSRFYAKTMNVNQLARADRVRDSFAFLDSEVTSHVMPSRERFLALTNLEQAAMWVIKAIAEEEGEDAV